MCLALFYSGARADAVNTESGLVDGTTEAAVRVFKGIPFAAPPVGDLRWRAPQPALVWSGVRKADRFSPVCPQHGAYPPESPPELMSEDCLYLNIWTPAKASAGRLPVMVWIYGGALENGSASTPLYSGDELAKRNVILVTINYRLGALGFLALRALSQESKRGISGNYGLLDQIAALRWVHNNIGVFGGDPQKVTVFGQSSGSISVSALVTSPLAKGLFQRAIGQSGGLFEPIDMAPGFKLAGAEKEGEEFVRTSGAKSLRDLRRMSAEEVLKTAFSAHFIVDGYALNKAPFDAYQDGEQNDVDVLVGTNLDEGQLFFATKTVTVSNFNELLAGDFSRPIVWLMGPMPGVSDSEARASATTFEGDMRFRWDMWTWARLAADAGKTKVFFYQFSRTPPFPFGARYVGLGATHGMEMPYVFDHLDQQPVPWTAQDRKLASVMSAYWTNFAAAGDPNGPGLPKWPEFGSSAKQVMILGDEIKPERIPHEDHLQRIDRVYASVRFSIKHRYLLLVALALTAVTIVVAAIAAFRKWRVVKTDNAAAS
jgi:para-nitrobenzyl esterase